MTFPHNPQFPTPGPTPGGFRPGPPPSHNPQPYAVPPARAEGSAPASGEVVPETGRTEAGRTDAGRTDAGRTEAGHPETGRTETGHPAVDAVLRSLENAARLAPGDQIAEYEAAHQVLQETLASIDG